MFFLGDGNYDIHSMLKPQEIRFKQIKLMATHGQLPERLSLYDIGLLSGQDPHDFEALIKKTDIEIEEIPVFQGAVVLGAHKATYKRYLQNLGQWPDKTDLVGWWYEFKPLAEAVTNVDAVDSFEPARFKPRIGGYGARDIAAINLVKVRPELLSMRPGKIKEVLQAANNQFRSGYPDWWRGNPIFKKGTPGRNPK